jgi:hypothetical protein
MALTGPALAQNFTFSKTNQDTASVTPTSLTINQPVAGGAGLGIFSSNFSTSGDFTTSVTQTEGGGPGDEEDVAFEVLFAGGGETVQGVRLDSFGQPVPPEWGGSFTPGSLVGAAFDLGHYSVTLGLERVGDKVTLLFDGVPVGSEAGVAYGGAATYELYFSNSGNSESGAATWSNFNVSAAPEPATWAMLITGMGAMSAVLRRRRNVNLVAA